jgi:CO dehydrogenase/acetyl-CoA synthase beta subunit
MSVFDPYIAETTKYIEQLRKRGLQVKQINCPVSPDQLLAGLPIKVGPKSSGGVILRSDTFVELGNPDAGSAAFFLWTDDIAMLSGCRITLIGPDIPESEGASLPFGQVLIIGGTGLDVSDHSKLEGIQHVGDQIEGYMIKSVPQRTWSRISREAADKGFNFEMLGKALIYIYKSAVPKIEAMEVLFVTSSKQDLEPLDKIGEQVREIAYNITKETWKAKGYDIECFSAYDCESCPDSAACSEIKEMINVRKKKKASKRKAEKG